MVFPTTDLRAGIAGVIEEYRSNPNPALLRDRLLETVTHVTPGALVAAAEEFRDDPEVTAVLYEHIVERQPTNARALVILANAWWLLGRGPQAVGELASRALAADPANRGAWHLWALSEPDIRLRISRWQQVVARFPGDDLARVSIADNAASLAGAEHDHEALDLAIVTYEALLHTASQPAQREALERAIGVLRGWKL